MGEIDEWLEKKKKKVDTILENTVQANQDSRELFRDLSTFEENFIQRNDRVFQSKLNEMQRRVQETQKKMKQIAGDVVNREDDRVDTDHSAEHIFEIQRNPKPDIFDSSS